jgi:hypothetical protein
VSVVAFATRDPNRVTWHLNSGLDIEQVATSVNAMTSTIQRYYDAADQFEEYEQRR